MKRYALLLAAGLLLAGCTAPAASAPADTPETAAAAVETAAAVSRAAPTATPAPSPTPEPEPYVRVRCTVEQNGTRISTQNPRYTGVTVYYYDQQGSLLHEQEVQTNGSRDRSHLACTYDGTALTRAESWYENTLVEYETYTNDDAGRPVSKVCTTVAGLEEDPDIRTDYTYDAAGRLTGEVVTRMAGSGMAQAVTARREYVYDEAGRCIEKNETDGQGSPTGQIRWIYDEAGRPTRKEQTVFGSLTTTSYVYDEAGRLSEETTTFGSGLAPERICYTYDAAGNLQTETYADADTGEVRQTVTYEWKPLSQALADQLTLAITDADSGLVLRAGAGTDQAKIDTMPKASAVVLLETTTAPDGSGWARVRYGDKEGYCSTDYLIVS